jgi:two-component system, chemotaxis family, sensor kinase CheA
MNAPAALGDGSAFHDIFFEEADEHLAAIEAVLLRLEPEAPAADDLNAIFRAAHSIKGTSGMLGFSEIAALTHLAENLLDLLRKKERPLTRRDIDGLLRASDVVRLQVAFRRGAQPAAPESASAEAELRTLCDLGRDPGGEAPERSYAVRLAPLSAPVDDADLALMLAGLEDMGRVSQQEIRNEAGGEIRFQVALAGAADDLRSVLSLVVAPGLISIEQIQAEPKPVPRATEALENKDAVEFFVTPAAWRRRATDSQIPAAPIPTQTAASDAGSIRVSVEKIDRLVNLVGELVITEAMLAQQQEHGGRDRAAQGGAGLADLSRHTRNLQEAVLAIRMVPISAVFTRFPRLVRELSQRLGKEVELRLAGEATELDRGLIEKITDPLTHLVRNAVDHGLETPEIRLAAGKPACGSVSLSAMQRGGNIVIEIRDDGRGLDREKIIARAAERGMPVSPDAPDAEVFQRIFEPGFSTAEQVTDVSGRGVGMDVVRRNIQLLRGKVELASQAGQGTTVTVSVPLTLAIIEAMTVAVNGEIYALPLSSVIESRRVLPEEIRSIGGQGATLKVRGDYLPVHRLGQGEIAVIVEAGGARAALLVDALVGQQQVVVKSLEANFRRVPGVAGATIMGDGKVALILDMEHIVSAAGADARLSGHQDESPAVIS